MSEWREWNGGECPVAGDVIVQTRWANGKESAAFFAAEWNWGHDGSSVDIIAYRVVEPATEPAAEDGPQTVAEAIEYVRRKGTKINDAGCGYGCGADWRGNMNVQVDCPIHDWTRKAEPEELDALLLQRPGEVMIVDADDAKDAEITRLRAELAARTEAWEGEEWKLRSEIDRAWQQIARLLDNADEAAKEIKRLRGVSDAPACDGSHMVGETYSRCPQHPKSPPLAMVADTLDPRLGTQQPDGEPVRPMSARGWRWLP